MTAKRKITAKDMTKKEAAEMIRDDMRIHHNYLSGTYRHALKMAAEELEKEELTLEEELEKELLRIADILEAKAAEDKDKYLPELVAAKAMLHAAQAMNEQKGD